MLHEQSTDTLAFEGFKTWVTVPRKTHISMNLHTPPFEPKALVPKAA